MTNYWGLSRISLSTESQLMTGGEGHCQELPPNPYIATGDIETGAPGRIPFWIFGMVC